MSNNLAEKLKEMDPKYIYAMLGGIILVFAALDLFFIARWQLSGIAATEKKIAQIKSDISSLKDNKTRLNQFQKALQDLRQKRDNFDRMVYKKDDLPTVLKSISTMANDNGIKIDQLVPQKQTHEQLVKNGDGQYSSMSVFVSVRGGFHEIGRFVSQMERERLFWRLDDFRLQGNPDEPQRHTLKMSLKILFLEK